MASLWDAGARQTMKGVEGGKEPREGYGREVLLRERSKREETRGERGMKFKDG